MSSNLLGVDWFVVPYDLLYQLLNAILQVSTSLDMTIRSSLLLRLIIELGVEGYQVGPRSKMNLVNLIEAMRSNQRTWRNPKLVTSWHEFSEFEPPGLDLRWYEEDDGVFYKRYTFIANDLGATGNVAPQTHTQIEFINFYDAARDLKTKILCFPMENVSGVHLELEQDLLVLREEHP